ncbi:RNA-directed DNA polymerase [Bacillus cereus group sp. BfR-BA-01119]|uniref:RNA-directed DNA polymerase n=1 Tax=Bacillus cereus group TaxID=86661 RepID=UPI0015C3C1F9|nr:MULTISPECIES: RNA-directed DNA polymerase [unclassified Bacillus cereus group]MDX5868491.1 RNA-directed DNA polymerase [Bacillus cereus group sp. BfR-BA-01119]MDX5911123.1 RNA-directed DNA polymerase [Bacillus cereus group sp. BfR-BA-01029]
MRSALKKIRNYIKFNKYFSMSFLIKYGYFDFKYNLKQHKEDYMLSNMVFKKVFNTNELEDNYPEIIGVKFKSKKETVPILLSIYKNEDERRVYKLPNIYSYICLCRHLHEHQHKYMEILGSSNQSISKDFYTSSFLTGKIKREDNRIGKRKLFKTDIQNFYPSIYTHSIPWVLVGKSEAKKNKNEKNTYYNALDSLIQKCQLGETHGIPTGSFASRLIAEIYMCKLDEKLSGYQYIRYVDDFEFPYNDENEKSQFYKDLNKELNSLNLKVKVEKNQIDLFPFQDNNNLAFFFDYFTKNDGKIKTQQKRIYNFIEESIYKEREGHKGSLVLMFKALKDSITRKELHQDTFTTPMLNKLFNLVLMKPNLAVNYLEFVDVLEEEKVENELKYGIQKIESQIKENISRYIDLNYNQELYSLLSIFYYLDILTICSKEQLFKIIKEMDDLSSILSFELLLYDESNIDDNLFKLIEIKLENSISWEEEFWLFKYHVLYRINEDKKSKLYNEFKNYLYNHYNDGIEKSKFFNQNNIKKIESPINVEWQHANSDQDISNFFKVLLDKKICFICIK